MFKIQPREVSALIRKARRSSHRSLKSIADEAGVGLATVQRYESRPNASTARVVSVLLALGFEITPKNSEIRLPAAQAQALRRLLAEVRAGARDGHVPLGVIFALEVVNTVGAGAALVRALQEGKKPATLAGKGSA